MNYSNCSVYYLPHGTVELYDTAQQLIRTLNETIRTPILYITNCSLDYDDVYQYYTEYLSSSVGTFITENSRDSYRSGLILVLFTYSAIVVSSWMLLIVLYLSTNKKPLSIKLASLLYSISVSIILHKTTKLLEQETRLGIQSVERFEDEILNGTVYLVLMVVTQTFTFIAWLEILVYIMPVNYQKKTIVIGLVMIIINTVLEALNSCIAVNDGETSSVPIAILAVCSQISIQVSFFVLFIGYILQRVKISYNKHTWPLAIMTIVFMLTPFVFYILTKYAESLRTWSGFFYTFGQVISCALIWEWISDIEIISKDIEFKGIVGREIDDNSNTKFKSLYQFFKKGKVSTNESADSSYELSNLSTYSSRQSMEDENVIDSIISEFSESRSMITYDRVNNNSIIENDVEMVENEPQLPPDFEPHPNFQIGDYYIDQKTHL